MSPRRPLLLSLVCALALCLHSLALAQDAGAPAAAGSVPQKLSDFLQPAVKHGGFAMDGYILWCSSVIKVDGTYNMFASRWPGSSGMGGWTTQSECVRATSTNLLGPYQFQEVVMQKRPDHWDKSRVHNVKIVKAGDKYVIFYINSANETGYAASDSITGPWTRSDAPVIRASNPAPLVRADGSLYVFCRLRDAQQVNRGVAFTAPSYEGPYTPVANGENLLPGGGELEDPTIWWANNQYNIVLNDWKGHATGVMKNGAQYFSKDGIQYTLVSHDPVFTKSIVFDDGSKETVLRRERPFVYVDDKGVALALFTACLETPNESRIVVQPINHYYPDNH